MIRRMMINDFKKNRLVYASILIFMALSGMLIGITTLLFGNLLNSIDNLMETAKTPDFLQMHAGEVREEEIFSFASGRSEVSEVQIAKFLNIEGGLIEVSGQSLENSTQDNGLCVQNENFDILIGMDGTKICAKEGEAYVPVAYRGEYKINVGDEMKIGGESLVVAGFLRDSQMNSMMASSKRFLVSEADYEKFRSVGSEEYLIEFDLKEGADINAFSTAYSDAKLPENGPTITYSLVKLMNALSDGTMILVILVVSVVVLMISIVCIRYILLTSIEKDRREAGLLKAVGLSRKDIKKVYITKYVVLAGIGGAIGAIGALALSKPLGQGMRDLYGTAGNEGVIYAVSLALIMVVEGVVLLSINREIRKLQKISAVQALRGEGGGSHRKNKFLFVSVVVAAAVFLMAVPKNISSTISAPEFVTYMGIGECQVIMDVREASDIVGATKVALEDVSMNGEVEDYAVMLTKNFSAVLEDGTRTKLLTEVGNHGMFPVKYSEGRYPGKACEIALSNLNATELKVKIGDKILIDTGDGMVEFTVCGIYSDITNGGKTAKIYEGESELLQGNGVPAMWSVFYISLCTGVNVDEWILEEEGSLAKANVEARIIDIAGRVEGTYGHTIKLVELAGWLATGAAAMIIFVVVLLFVRLIIWQERNDCSLKKALGYKNVEIKKAYLKRAVVYIIAGTILGIILGVFGGQALAGTMLKSLGASGFRFILNLVAIFVLIPVVSLAVSTGAVLVSVREISNIKAYECCVGRE